MPIKVIFEAREHKFEDAEHKFEAREHKIYRGEKKKLQGGKEKTGGEKRIPLLCVNECKKGGLFCLTTVNPHFPIVKYWEKWGSDCTTFGNYDVSLPSENPKGKF